MQSKGEQWLICLCASNNPGVEKYIDSGKGFKMRSNVSKSKTCRGFMTLFKVFMFINRKGEKKKTGRE